MRVYEVRLDDCRVLEQLIDFSKAWESEDSCWGYRANNRTDIEGNRIFFAADGDDIIGYLFGKRFDSKNMWSIMPENTPCFEIEELYVTPARRSQGVGQALFRYAETVLAEEADYIVLGTATKNWRAILHFYLDELGMDFWSARLFKRIEPS